MEVDGDVENDGYSDDGDYERDYNDDEYGLISKYDDDDSVHSVEKKSTNKLNSNNHFVEHGAMLLKSLKYQKEEEKNLDLNIRLSFDSETKLVPVHRCVISASCPYAKSYLENMPEKEGQIIDLNHLNGNSVLKIINWMYSGVCDLNDLVVQDVLISADFLCIEPVVKQCVDYLCNNLTFQNCSEIYNLTHTYSFHDFPRRVSDFIINDFYTLFTGRHLDSLAPNDIIAFTSSDNFWLETRKFFDLSNCDREHHLFEIMKDYVKRKNKYDLWPEILTKSVRLGFLSDKQLQQMTENDSWLGDCKEKKKCLEYIKGVLENQKQDMRTVEFPVWSTPRKDLKVFQYFWTEKIARDGYFPDERPQNFNDLKTQLAKKENKNGLVIVRGMKIWFRSWDGPVTVVGGIATTYNDGTVETHGLTEERTEGVAEFVLKDGEFINRIECRMGALVDQLTFYTNFGNKYGPYGGFGGYTGKYKPKKPNGFLAAFSGQKTSTHRIPAIMNVRFCWGYRS